MATVQLPGGHTAELREKPTVGGRDLLRSEGAEVIRLLNERWPGLEDVDKIPPLEFGRDLTVAFQRLNKAAVVALVKSWTLPTPKPTVETLDEMEEEVYDALAQAVAPLALKAMTGEDFSPTKDADSPTLPSSSSSGGGQDQTTRATALPTGSSASETNTTTAPAST